MSTKLTVNPWKKFRNLLPDGSRTYGTVATVNVSTNSSLVTLQSGDQVIVKGSAYAVSTRVLIADGEIRQSVSGLPFTAVELF